MCRSWVVQGDEKSVTHRAHVALPGGGSRAVATGSAGGASRWGSAATACATERRIFVDYGPPIVRRVHFKKDKYVAAYFRMPFVHFLSFCMCWLPPPPLGPARTLGREATWKTGVFEV
jgi:hypothetical protein